MDVLRGVEEEMLLSECSSGCESGWTLYLDEMEGGPWDEDGAVCSKIVREEDQEEDGTSTVSDASSGPPVFHGTDCGSACFCFSPCYRGSCSCRSPLSSSYYTSPTLATERSDQQGTKRRRVEEEDKQVRLYHSFRDLLEDTATSLPSYHPAQATASITEPFPSHCFLASRLSYAPDFSSVGPRFPPEPNSNLDLSIFCCSSATAGLLKSHKTQLNSRSPAYNWYQLQRRFSPEEHPLSSSYAGRPNSQPHWFHAGSISPGKNAD